MEENSKAPPSGNPRTGYQKPFPSFGMFHSLDGAELIGLGSLWLSETDSRRVRHLRCASAAKACHPPVVARRVLPRACEAARAKRFGATRRLGRQSASRRQAAVRRAQIRTRCD